MYQTKRFGVWNISANSGPASKWLEVQFDTREEAEDWIETNGERIATDNLDELESEGYEVPSFEQAVADVMSNYEIYENPQE